MSIEEIEKLKKTLKLEKHPEGNEFVEMWRGDRQTKFTTPTKHDGPRSVGSSIHTLLTPPDFISWHRVLSDEMYFWHAGGAMKVYLLDSEGHLRCVILGDLLKYENAAYQVTIPHDTWYAAEVIEGDYVLFSAVVIPGFEFKDWTAGQQEEMLKKFPQHSDLISRLIKKH